MKYTDDKNRWHDLDIGAVHTPLFMQYIYWYHSVCTISLPVPIVSVERVEFNHRLIVLRRYDSPCSRRQH